MTKSAVIFGGCGFIGLFYAEKVLKLGFYDNLYLVDIFEPKDEYCLNKYKKLLNDKKVKFIKKDIRENLNDLRVEGKVNIILNFAAVHREPGHKANEYFETNINGAQNICNFAKLIDCKNIIFTSSIAVYGQGDHIKNEDTIVNPSTPYGKSKYSAEKIHIQWKNENINEHILSICRPGVVYGPGEKGNITRLVKFVKKKIFFYMGNNQVKKGGIYIKELINILIWVNQNQLKNKIPNYALFNASIDPCPTLQTYVEKISKIYNYSGNFLTIPKFMIKIFLSISMIFTTIFKLNNSFSYYRLIKLFRHNNIVPNFLNKNNYVFLYDISKSLKDWKRINPSDW